MGSVNIQSTRSTLTSVDTTLSENITATQNYIPVASTTNFSTSVVAEIESTNEVVSFDTITIQKLKKTDFASSSWILRRVTKTLNAGTAPDGTNTAVSIVPTASTTHRVDQNPAGLDTTTEYTFSVYGKQNGYTGLSLTIGQGSNISVSNTAYFDLSSGTVASTVAGTTAAIQDAGNGWFRCAITTTTAGSIAINAILIGVGSDSSTFSFTGNTIDGILIWGPQLEISSSVTGFLPNETLSSTYPGLTTVTRGVNGTTAASASSGDSIQQLPYALGSLDMPVRLKAISVSPDGTGAARLTLCDNNGDTLCDVDIPNAKSYTLNMPEDGIIFPNGVFVSNTDNITAYTVYTEKYSGPSLTS
jgi:hypothetical protein